MTRREYKKKYNSSKYTMYSNYGEKYMSTKLFIMWIIFLIIAIVLLCLSVPKYIHYEIEGKYKAEIVSDGYVSSHRVSSGRTSSTHYIYDVIYTDKDGNVVKSNYDGFSDKNKGDIVEVYSNDKDAKSSRTDTFFGLVTLIIDSAIIISELRKRKYI